ncbi:hypothetical protein QO010_001931 [Caulobacter ginsengisoli]|uniref:Lipoprotein n=1 Tax=Caulobacter ginsengisoli TaxID=400775 RepID=A0ABU0IRX0_9CAUL|nr:hypothetical protein [Caulobacter ginsengisoli]MDQ0464160.1 hypothetical protein [Caulobacter ginsengisoli]
MRRKLLAIAAVILLAACAQPKGALYKVPIAEARQTLLATGLPPLVFGSDEPMWEVQDAGSDVIWIVKRDRAELFRYIAHLSEEEGGATRVSVELKGAESGPAGNVAQRLAEKPEIRDMYLVAIKEQVAAALERRPFEMARLYPALTKASLASIGSLQASADAAAAASEAQDRANIEKAYADEAAGRR